MKLVGHSSDTSAIYDKCMRLVGHRFDTSAIYVHVWG